MAGACSILHLPTSQVLLLWAALNLPDCPVCGLFGIAPNQVQGLAFGHIQLHGTDKILLPQPVLTPLDALSSLQTINHTTQLVLLPDFAEQPTQSHQPCH